MPLLPSSFNAKDVQPISEWTPVPKGKYTVMITESEMKTTLAGDGEYLKLTFKILDAGDFNGRLVWSNLNLVNKNDKAVEIAQRELSGIMHAAEMTDATDSTELHSIPMLAKIGIVPEQGGYKASNNISFFEAA